MRRPTASSPSGAAARAHVFVESLDDDLTITGPDAHHLARVRRLHAGERVTAADGTGAWRAYDVAAAPRGSVVLAADGEVRHEPPLVPGLVVAVALLPPARLDALVAPLSELGVDRLVPVETERVQAAPPNDARLGRLRTIAREAAMQCRRAVPLVVEPAVTLGALVATSAARERVVVAAPDGDDAHALDAPAHGGAWVVVSGPEGGFGARDEALLGGARRLRLAPHVLRAETAPVAAAAVLTQRRE